MPRIQIDSRPVFLSQALAAGVGQGIVGFIGHQPHRIGQFDIQRTGGGDAVQHLDRAADLDIELGPGIVGQLGLLFKQGLAGGLGDQLERLGVDDGRGLPVVKDELGPLGEKDRKLPALGAHPETVLAAVGRDMGLGLAGGDQLVVDPAEAEALVAVGRAGHHAALIGRHDRDLGLARRVRQHDRVGVLLQKRHILSEILFTAHGNLR